MRRPGPTRRSRHMASGSRWAARLAAAALVAAAVLIVAAATPDSAAAQPPSAGGDSWARGLKQAAAGGGMGTCSDIPKYKCIPATGAQCCPTAGMWAKCTPCPKDAVAPSKMWGCGGELWKASRSRLADWSFAGYQLGDYDVPAVEPLGDMQDTFGARGDGVSDDTAAFELAIDTVTESGVFYLPEGVYVLTRRLDITKRIFFQGAGPGKTVITFSKSLTDLSGNTWPGGISQYSWGPGLINFNGADFPDASTLVTRVTADAARGDRWLTVASSDAVQVGQVVRLLVDNVRGALLDDLNGGYVPGSAAYDNRGDVLRFASRVTAVTPARVQLERALPFNVSTAWRPELHNSNGLRRNSTGFSDLTFRFPADAWPGEYKDEGFNAVYFYGVANSWISNVAFENADIGIVFDQSSACTVQNVTFASSRPTSVAQPLQGNTGIMVKSSYDLLVHDFNVQARLLHSVAVSHFSSANVFSKGRGTDVSIELLWSAPSGNLFTDIDFGEGSAPFGWVMRGQDAAGDNAFWNLRASRAPNITLPPLTWAPRVSWVNVANAKMWPLPPPPPSVRGKPAPPAPPPPAPESAGWSLDLGRVYPPNLWLAQRRARGRPFQIPPPLRFYGPGYNCTADGGAQCGCKQATPDCGPCPDGDGAVLNPSVLWGCQGELWKPKSRIPYDWSFAGYRQGAVSVPSPAATQNIKNFGAKGDGVTDDTAAVLKALETMPRGVLLFPAGTYVITSVINFRKAIVLRGEGIGRSVLSFPKSLTDLYGNTWVEGKWKGTSQYSHGTGFINIGGWDPNGRDYTRLTYIRKDARQGERVLQVGNAADVDVGAWVRVWMRDPGDGGLMRYLNPYMDNGDALKGYADPVRFLSRVIDKGPDWVKLERPLPVDVRSDWLPELHKFLPMLDGNTGLENLSVRFPWSPYKGHFQEQGFNGIHMNQVANGWVRNVEVVNGDLGLYLWGAVFTTVDNLVLAARPSPRGFYNGHRGIWSEHGSDNLFRNIRFESKFIHDFSLAGTEHGTVLVNSSGADVNFDHHRSAPYLNLFTNVDVGIGTRVFDASGDVQWGPHSAFGATFWNVSGRMMLGLPRAEYGGNLTFVGLPTVSAADPPQNWHVELLDAATPASLYDAMKATRAARLANTW